MLNHHNVKNRGPILNGALDTLKAALHLWWSSWLQHRAKSRTTGEAAEERPLLFFSPHIYKHEICSTCRVLRPSVWVCARACYSLSACVGDVWRHCVFTVHDHCERLAVVSLLEGGLTTDQHEEDYPQTPDICRDTERMPSVYTNTSLCAHALLRSMVRGMKGWRTNRVKHKCPFCLVTYILKKTRAVSTTDQMEHESYSIRAISINMYWLRTHLSNRWWGFALLPAAGVMLTHTHTHTWTPTQTHSPRKVG